MKEHTEKPACSTFSTYIWEQSANEISAEPKQTQAEADRKPVLAKAVGWRILINAWNNTTDFHFFSYYRGSDMWGTLTTKGIHLALVRTQAVVERLGGRGLGLSRLSHVTCQVVTGARLLRPVNVSKTSEMRVGELMRHNLYPLFHFLALCIRNEDCPGFKTVR